MITKKQRLRQNVSVKARNSTGFRAWREPESTIGLMVIELSQAELNRMNDIIDTINDCFSNSCGDFGWSYWQAIIGMLNDKLPKQKIEYLGLGPRHDLLEDCLQMPFLDSCEVRFTDELFCLPQDAPRLEQAIKQDVLSYFGLGWQNVL